jgi:excisionase family DNA binding protein
MVGTKGRERVALSVSEAAAMAGVSEKLIREPASRGSLPGARHLGGRLVIHAEAFTAWLREGKGR